MLALIGSLIGFVSSFGGHLLRSWIENKRLNNSLALAQLKSAAATIEKGHAELGSELRGLPKPVKIFVSTTTPVVTYLFVLFWMISSLILLTGGGWFEKHDYEAVWDNEMQAILGTIIGFWFHQSVFVR